MLYPCKSGWNPSTSSWDMVHTSTFGFKSDSLSPAVTLKIRSRSPKPNQLIIMSQCYIHANLVKIYPPVHEISCKQESVTPTPTGSAPKTMSLSPSVGDIINGHYHKKIVSPEKEQKKFSGLYRKLEQSVTEKNVFAFSYQKKCYTCRPKINELSQGSIILPELCLANKTKMHLKQKKWTQNLWSMRMFYILTSSPTLWHVPRGQ